MKDVQGVLRAMVPGLEEHHFQPRDRPLSEGLDHAHVQTVTAAVMRLNPDISRQALASGATWNDVFAWLEEVDEEVAPGADERPPRGSYVSPNTTLRPLTPVDIDALYHASLDPRANHRWRFRGGTPSPAEFHQALYSAEVLCQYMVVDLESRHSVGLVTAYAADHMARHARVAIQRLLPEDAPPESKGLMIEGFGVFVQYLFDHFDLNKVYVEVPEYNMSLFDLGPGSMLKVEGRLKDHMYWGDRTWDMCFLAMYREDWETVADHFRGRWPEGHFDRQQLV
jgi:RimJ/RimL family protein N-acetyltransferase